MPSTPRPSGPPTSSTPAPLHPPVVRAVALAVVAALILFIVGAVFSGVASADSHRVWVCKYVGTPGVDESLGPGKNPISVSANATDGAGVGGFFNDAQGRSYVLAVVQGDDDDDDDDGPKCPKTPPGNGTSTTTPPVTTTTPPVTETTPPVTETTPPVTETTPPVTETTPPVTETTPPVTETTPPVTETTPPVTSTTTPDTPGAAPTDLGPTQTTGIFSLFAIAAGLFLAAARLLRGARH